MAATVSGKENIAGDAAVIGSRARQLEQLIPQIAVRQAARADTVLDPQSALPPCSSLCELVHALRKLSAVESSHGDQAGRAR